MIMPETTTNMASQAEIIALQRRIVELEGALEEATHRADLYEAIFQRIPTGVIVWHLEDRDDPFSLRLLAINPAGNKQANQEENNTRLGRRMVDLIPNASEAMLQLYAGVIRSGQSRDMGESVFPSKTGEELTYSIRLFPVPGDCLCVVFENVTERKRAEAMLRQSIALEETIRAQQVTLAELSTPLIPITDHVTVMPLIGSVDSRRAQQVIETLLHGISTSRAEVAILDITGVPVVDTQVADALLRAAQAVKLLGARVVLTGIRPEVAQTLVGLGTDLSGVTTRSSLQSGIAFATGRG